MNKNLMYLAAGVAIGYVLSKKRGQVSGRLATHYKTPLYTTAVLGRGWRLQEWEAKPPTMITRVHLTT